MVRGARAFLLVTAGILPAWLDFFGRKAGKCEHNARAAAEFAA
jgi:hypothetical protein